MRITFKRKALTAYVALVLLCSCNIDDFDFDRVSDPSISLGIKAPFAKGDYTMSQFVDNIDDPDGLISVGPDSLYHIIYKEDSIFTYHSSELVEIPQILSPSDFDVDISQLLDGHLPSNMPINGLYIPIKDVEPFVEAKKHIIDLGNKGDKEDIILSQIRMSTATFVIKLNSNINSPITATITLDNCYKDGTPVVCVLSDQNPEKTISIDGSVIKFEGLEDDNTLLYSTSIKLEDNGNAHITPNDNVNIQLQIKDIEAEYIQGDFGQRVIDIIPESLNFSSDIFKSLGGNITLLNPIINLNISNSIGVPASVDFQISADTKGAPSVLLNPENLNVEVPTTVGDLVHTSNVIDRDNSNIVNLVSSLPVDSLLYFGAISINQLGRTNTNFVTNSSLINIDMEMDLPLEITVEEMAIIDTIPFDIIDPEISIEYTYLWIDALNEIPLSIASELVFIDTLTKKQVSRRIKLEDFAAALADDEGNSIEATRSKIEIALNEEDVVDLMNSNAIVLDARLRSPEQGKKPAKLKAEYKIDLQMKLETRATINQ